MGASTTFSARYYDALVQDACDQHVEAWTSLELREGSAHWAISNDVAGDRILARLSGAYDPRMGLDPFPTDDVHQPLLFSCAGGGSSALEHFIRDHHHHSSNHCNTPNQHTHSLRLSSTRSSSNARIETETENEEVPNIQRHIRRCPVPPKRMYTQRTMLSRRSSNKPPLHDRAIQDR